MVKIQVNIYERHLQLKYMVFHISLVSSPSTGILGSSVEPSVIHFFMIRLFTLRVPLLLLQKIVFFVYVFSR